MNRIKKLILASLIIAVISCSGVGMLITQELNRSTQKEPIRVAVVGDSITQGFGYPENLQRGLGINYVVGNFGLGGTTVSLDSDTPYMNSSVFNEAIDSQPNIVVIMLGTNDAHPELERYSGNFVNDYLTLINQFQKLESKPRIWIVKPPPIFSNGTGLSTQLYEKTVIPNIEEVAKESGLPLIDTYLVLANRSDCFYDGVHPTPLGSMLIADEVLKAITNK
jgi:lysophospholipase L1-like esterase